MAHAVTQTTPIMGKTTGKVAGVGTRSTGSTGLTVSASPAVQPANAAPVAPVPNREKALQILSKSIYKELRENGYQPKQIVALATEIISLVTTDIGDGPTS
jgi:hypothetical protein